MKVSHYNEINLEKVVRNLNLIIPSQDAKLGPPVGPILGQYRIKIKDFCNNFNNKTKVLPFGLPISVYIYIYRDDSFHFILKTPSVMFLINNLLKKRLKINIFDLYKISLIKKKDLPYLSLKSIFRSILATSDSMNLKINRDLNE